MSSCSLERSSPPRFLSFECSSSQSEAPVPTLGALLSSLANQEAVSIEDIHAVVTPLDIRETSAYYSGAERPEASVAHLAHAILISPVLSTATKGDALEHLLNCGLNPNATGRQGRTLLHTLVGELQPCQSKPVDLLAEINQENMALNLLQMGAQWDHPGSFPLHPADPQSAAQALEQLLPLDGSLEHFAGFSAWREDSANTPLPSRLDA